MVVGLNGISRYCRTTLGSLEILAVVLMSFRGIRAAIYSVALTPDGTWALTGSIDTTARLWEIILRMPLVKVQEIIGAHEETTRNNAKQGR